MANKKTEEDKKTTILTVKMSIKEKEIIKIKALAHGQKPSTYLRNLGLNLPVKSIVDNNAVESLLRVNADMGRLGGLFKLWLVGDSTRTIPFSRKRSWKDIDNLVDTIEQTQQLLRAEALKIMRAKK